MGGTTRGRAVLRRGLRVRLRGPVGGGGTALANPELRKVHLGWAASMTGENVAVVAFAVHAYEAGGAAAVGLVSVVQMVPSALTGPATAVLGDRLRRELVVVVSDLLRSAVMVAAALAVALSAPLLVVYVLAALLAVLQGAFYPAQTALVPLLARTAQEVTTAAAVSNLLRNFAALAAPAAAGAVLLLASDTAVFAVAAAAFAAAALLVRGVPRTDAVRSAPAMTSAWSALMGGVRAAAADSVSAFVLAVLLAHSLARGAVAVLLVVVPLELLDTGSSGIGFVSGLLGAGAFLGAVAWARVAGRRRLARPMGLGLALTGGPLLVAAAVTAAPVVLLAVGAVGAGLAVVSVSATTLLVRAARDDVLSRVLGVLGTVRAAGIALGAGLTPVLLDVAGLRWTMAATGALVVAVLLTARPRLRSVDAASTVPGPELALLRAAPVFAPLPPVALERLGTRLEPLAVAAGTAVVEEGGEGDAAYLVADGELVVEAAEAGGVVDRVGAGEVFGEMALLHGAPRNATVRAVGPCRLYRLTREEFLAAVTGHPRSSVRALDLVASRLAHRRQVLEDR